MKKILSRILSLLMFLPLLSNSDGQVYFSSFERAKLHPVTSERPATDFFDNDRHNITFIVSSSKNNKGDVFIDGEIETKSDYFVRYGSESPEDFTRFEYNLTIGAGNNRGTVETFFRGYLDEKAFYNRPLTTREILQLLSRY